MPQLVLHQRQQGRHHQRRPRQQHRGQLVAQRLARPCAAAASQGSAAQPVPLDRASAAVHQLRGCFPLAGVANHPCWCQAWRTALAPALCPAARHAARRCCLCHQGSRTSGVRSSRHAPVGSTASWLAPLRQAWTMPSWWPLKLAKPQTAGSSAERAASSCCWSARCAASTSALRLGSAGGQAGTVSTAACKQPAGCGARHACAMHHRPGGVLRGSLPRAPILGAATVQLTTAAQWAARPPGAQQLAGDLSASRKAYRRPREAVQGCLGPAWTGAAAWERPTGQSLAQWPASPHLKQACPEPVCSKLPGASPALAMRLQAPLAEPPPARPAALQGHGAGAAGTGCRLRCRLLLLVASTGYRRQARSARTALSSAQGRAAGRQAAHLGANLVRTAVEP